jgi:cyclomaltodextrinase
MNQSAIIHTNSSHMQCVLHNRDVTLRLVTGKDITRAHCIHGDPHMWIKSEEGHRWEHTVVEMEKVAETATHFIFQVTFTPKNYRIKYHFIVCDEHECMQFGEDGFTPMSEEVGLWNNFFIPYVHSSLAVNSPSWVKDTIWYQIFPDRFNNGNPNNDRQETVDWVNGPVNNKVSFGGDLKGITQKLDYLKKLGFNGIYLTPIFASPTAHKYDTIDYFEIDPWFGSKEDLKTLVSEAHARGIKLMLDAVFNHTGRHFFAFEDVLKHKEKSKYKDWFHITSFEPFEYETFASAKNMPKINMLNKEARDYFVSVATYWVKDFNIDGWRFDVANEIDMAFLKEVHIQTRAINPNLYLLGEIWHDSTPWLNNDVFDGVMNYPTGRAILDFSNGDIDALTFTQRFMKTQNSVHPNILENMFTLLDSHDTPRLVHLLGHEEIKVKLALTLLYLSPGSICVYYGSETLLDGAHDPDNRRPMPWHKLNHDFIEFMSSIAAIRKHYPTITHAQAFEFVFENNLLKLRFKHEPIECWINIQSKPTFVSVDDLITHSFVITLPPYGALITQV